jgi:hypothetical protein
MMQPSPVTIPDAVRPHRALRVGPGRGILLACLTVIAASATTPIEGSVDRSVRAGVSADPVPALHRQTGFVGRWVANHLLIGASLTHFWLEDTRRATDHGYDNENLTGNFLGSLWGLDAQQHYFPDPSLEYRIISSFGVGFAYDQARAKTLDWGNIDTRVTTVGDGDVEIRGLQFYLFGRYPNRTRLTPYANVGLARYWSRFLVSPLWAAPGRHLDVDSTRGWFLSSGFKLALGRHLGLDAFYRHSRVGAVSGRAYFHGIHHRSGAFPMRNNRLGAGVFYAF